MGRTLPRDRARPARLSAEERRSQLIDVARRMILEEGVEAVTMESVAMAAGVSKTLGYAYFENRTGLLMALLGREVDELTRRAESEMAAARSFEERVRAGVRAWFDLIDRGGVAGILLHSRQLHGALGDMRRDYMSGMQRLWGGMAAREYGLPADRASVAASILLAGLGGALERWTVTGEPRALLEETYVEVVMAAVEGMAARLTPPAG